MILTSVVIATSIALWHAARTVCGVKMRIRLRRAYRTLRHQELSSRMASLVSRYREEGSYLVQDRPGDMASANLIMLLAALTEEGIAVLAEDAVLRSERWLDERYATHFYRSERAIFARALGGGSVRCRIAVFHLERRWSALNIPRDAPPCKEGSIVVRSD